MMKILQSSYEQDKKCRLHKTDSSKQHHPKMYGFPLEECGYYINNLNKDTEFANDIGLRGIYHMS